MMKKDKNNQNTNSIPKYLWGNYFKKPIKWLAHLINNYGNSKHPFITTGTSYAYAVGDEKKRHPELTEQQIHEIVNSRIKQNRKKLGLSTNNTTPSLAAAGLALGSLYYPWLAIPDIIYDTAASIDEPSTSNNIHTIADFPETVAKFTPSKIDDYVAKGVLILGNIDDAISTSGKNMFSNFDKKPGKINNTTDKTSVRESTNIKYRKNGGAIRKMQTAAGGPLRLTPEELKYYSWINMSPELRRQNRNNKVKAYLSSAPSIGNFWEAFQTYIGNRDPKNPHLNTGEVPNPGMRNPTLILSGALKIKLVTQKVKSIAERAAKISDRVFDRQYQRAISSGNSKRVLAVRDLHFKGKTGNDLMLTTYRSLLSNKRSESQGLNPYNDTRHTVKHEGYFSTSSKDVANTYKVEEESPIFELYPYMKNPYVVDVNGRSWQAVELYHPEKFPHLTLGRTTDLVVRRVLSEGNNDGVILRNIMDVGPKRVNLNGTSEIADDYITFPGKAKLKDAITYDNNGNIIPISLRDNFLINDIRYKKGGKMNILEFLKNGSGIHIKEENKGKFTSYCGGKVTNECILKGKNSSNPAIRKRATFAANARKWKHEDGGTVHNGIKKHLEGAKLTFLKLGNFAKSDLGKSVISNGLSFLSDKLFNKSASSNLEIALAAQEKELSTIDPMQVAQMIEIAKNQYADPENPNANGGDIFNSYIKNQITAPILAKQLEEHKKRLAAIDLLKNQAKSSAVGTFFNTLAQDGIEYLLNKYGKTEKADS